MDKKRLDLRFRPNDVFSKPIYGDLKPASGLLLKVVYRRRRHDVPGPSTEDTQIDEEPQINVLGVVRSMFKFESKYTQINIYNWFLNFFFLEFYSYFQMIFFFNFLGLCDYQYLPIAKNPTTGKTEFIYDDIVPNRLLSPDWLTYGNSFVLFSFYSDFCLSISY